MDLSETRPLRPLLLPAVQHQLVQRRGTVQRSWQPETVLDRFDHLQHTHNEHNLMNTEMNAGVEAAGVQWSRGHHI